MLRKKIHTVLAHKGLSIGCVCPLQWQTDMVGQGESYDVFLYHVICCQFNHGNCHTIALPFIYTSQSGDLHHHASVIKQRFRVLFKVQPKGHLLQSYADTLDAAASQNADAGKLGPS